MSGLPRICVSPQLLFKVGKLSFAPNSHKNIELIIQTLAARDTLYHLARGEHPERVMALINALPKDAQATALASHDGIWGLAYSYTEDASKSQAPAVMAVIKELPQRDQIRVLSIHGAIWSLARNGQAAAIVDVLKKLSPSAQKKILAVRDTGSELRFNGQTTAVKEIRAAWNTEPTKINATPNTNSSGIPSLAPAPLIDTHFVNPVSVRMRIISSKPGAFRRV